MDWLAISGTIFIGVVIKILHDNTLPCMKQISECFIHQATRRLIPSREHQDRFCSKFIGELQPIEGSLFKLFHSIKCVWRCVFIRRKLLKKFVGKYTYTVDGEGLQSGGTFNLESRFFGLFLFGVGKLKTIVEIKNNRKTSSNVNIKLRVTSIRLLNEDRIRIEYEITHSDGTLVTAYVIGRYDYRQKNISGTVYRSRKSDSRLLNIQELRHPILGFQACRL